MSPFSFFSGEREEGGGALKRPFSPLEGNGVSTLSKVTAQQKQLSLLNGIHFQCRALCPQALAHGCDIKAAIVTHLVKFYGAPPHM